MKFTVTLRFAPFVDRPYPPEYYKSLIEKMLGDSPGVDKVEVEPDRPGPGIGEQ